MTMPRLTVLAGHYGSGKTNLAVNLALHLRRTQERVAIADLDIVNPYYRTRDARALLEAAGIDLIASTLAGSNLDAPAVSAGVSVIFDDPGLYVVADVGGDDRGALAMGRYAGRLEEHNSCQILFVYNCRRPLTATPEEALGVLREIESAGHFTFTGLLNNANIGDHTKPEDVLASIPLAGKLSRLCGLPIVLTSVRRELADDLHNKIDNLFPIDLVEKPEWAMRGGSIYGRACQ